MYNLNQFFMKNLFFILVALLFMVSCGNSSDKAKEKSDQTEQTEAECLHHDIKVELEDLLADYDEFVDEDICVSGIAIHICRHGGKRLFLAIDEEDEDYLVAVANDELEAFDDELVGERVRLVGKLIKVEEEEVETHHEKEVYYYLDASEVAKCKCDGQHKHEGCKGHAH